MICKCSGPGFSLPFQQLGLPSPDSCLGRAAEEFLLEESIIVGPVARHLVKRTAGLYQRGKDVLLSRLPR